MPASQRPRPVALRIELLDVEPLVWRRILVSNQWTFASLHGYLQWVFGWQDTHAHEFHVKGLIVASEWWIAERAGSGDNSEFLDERRFSVAVSLKAVDPRGDFEYHYDMGDGWRHRIVIEDASPAADSEWSLPLCTAGENACPPDDVGGPPGYAEFLAAIANKRDERHAEMLRWIGGVFDPRGFDLNRLNREWRGAKGRRR